MSAPFLSAGDIPTAANWNAFPRSILGYAERTVDQGGIGAETDLSGLFLTVDVGNSRRVMISAQAELRCTAANDRLVLRIKESTTELNSGILYPGIGSTTLGETLYIAAVIAPSSGSHTYKLTLERTVGAGVAGLLATATRPAFILVEDIGPA